MVLPKELPIYETCCMKKQTEDKVRTEGFLEPYIRTASQETCDALKPILGDYPQQAREQIDNAVDLTKASIAFVRQEENIAARAAFITGSTFLGLMLARRGFFRRITFAGIAAGGAASTCNPQMAKDYLEVGCTLVKQTATEFYEQNKDSISIDNVKKMIDNTTASSSQSSSPSSPNK